MDGNNRQMTAKEIWRGKNQGQQFNNARPGTTGNTQYYGNMKPRKPYKNKSLVIILSIVGGLFLVAILFAAAGIGGNNNRNISESAAIHEDYIGVLYIEGTIGEDSTTYNQEYVINTLDGMMENRRNRGLMLYINTPGGGVYESDEIYLKIKEYQTTTNRPVYVYMGSQATSGGYYISAPADKIIANRNCWTGSIGVTMGTMYDISGLLDKYGIKSETITSGKNKAMGSMTEPMTDEQRAIMQSMIDESYEQFVGIVAEGRDMELDEVKKIADGRIYTALQAKELGLVDEVVKTYDEATEDMAKECDLTHCAVYEFRYEEEPGLLTGLIKSVDKLTSALGGESDINALTELMEKQNELPLQYMSEVTK